MRKVKVVTNKTFEAYIDRITRGRKFEDRFDTLDLDDIVSDIQVPSESEITTSLRDLDLIDKAAAKSNGEVEVDNGKIRVLDLDENPKTSDDSDTTADLRTAGLDFDDPNGRRRRSNSKDDNDGDSRVRELDLDDPADVDNKGSRSNIDGVIGKLDYDDDIDTSDVIATVDDIYNGLSSSDAKVVQSIIKKYANDIKDSNKIKEVLLNHAIKLNYNSLKALCGDMNTKISNKDKSIWGIEEADVKNLLEKIKAIASSLTGENNTYGLIPNAIVSCSPSDQVNCINIIDFLVTWCGLPLMPIYFRGAMIRKCYDLANYLLEELPDESITVDLLTGKKGLLTRIRQYGDIPENMLIALVSKTVTKKTASSIIGDIIIICINNGYKNVVQQVDTIINFKSNKGQMVADYIENENEAAYDEVKIFFDER